MKRIAVLIIFIIIGGVIYFNSFTNGFHYDDSHHILKNPYISKLGNIPLFFTEMRTFSTTSIFHPHYRPLVMTSYAINYSLGRLNPRGYHMVNLGFHIGSAFLLFLILQAMRPLTSSREVRSFKGGWEEGWRGLFIPLAAGLLFLTTPYNSEVINYITARSTVMCTFFYLMTFYFWVRYREGRHIPITQTLSPQGRGKGWYIASLFAFLLAMLTKEIAITLPAMLWLYDLYFVERAGLVGAGIYARLKHYLVYIPFAIVGGLTGIIFRMIFFRSLIPENDVEPLTHLLVEIKVLSKYFVHMAMPVNLSALHTIQDTLNIYFFLSLLVILSLLALVYLLRHGRNPFWRMASFFIAWFFIVLLPTSFVALVAPYQENRGYLSAIGFAALTAVGLERLIKRTVSPEDRQVLIAYPLIGLLVIILSIGVVHRNRVWLTDGTLWSDVVKKYPSSTMAHLGLGNYYITSGQIGRAKEEFLTILNINPEDSQGLTSMGIIYSIMGEKEKAEELFRKALDIAPLEDSANYFMARLLESRGDLPLAAVHLMRVLAVRPDNLDASVGLINLYSRMGKLDDAYDRVAGALQKDPDNPAIRRALGLIYMIRGQRKEAAREFEIVLKYMPYDVRTLLDLGDIYSKIGLMELSEARLRLASLIDPKNPIPFQAMGVINQGQGRYDKALAMYKMALQVDPKSPQTLNNMGLIYREKGEYEKALSAFKIALEIAPSYHLARINLGKLYEVQGVKDLARKEYQKVLTDASPEDRGKDIYQEARERLAALK